MFEGSVTRCPLCGNKVPPGITRCPVCATEIQRVVARRAQGPLQAPFASEDYLRKELPKTDLPMLRLTCPLCAKELEGDEVRCPRCGIPLAREEPMLECPECGAQAPAGAKACPRCGVGFVEEVEAGASRPPPPEEPLLRGTPSDVPRPPPPELVTRAPEPAARAREGFVNGRGTAAGAGFVNGTGMINGTGITNGTRLPTKPSQAVRHRSLLRRWQFLTVLVALAVIVSTFVYLSYANQEGAFAIDGDFGEWSSVPKFGAYTVSGYAPIDFDQWAVGVEGTRLFVYVRTQGQLMATSDVDSFYVFIDSDSSYDSGYQLSGLGADYLVELSGWEGAIRSTSVKEYRSSTDRFDWNAWVDLGSLAVRMAGDELEAMAELPVPLTENARFMLISHDSLERSALSYPVPYRGGLLVVHQEPGPDVQSSGLVGRDTSVALLRLRFVCEGSSGVIAHALPAVVGAVGVTTIQDLQLAVGQERVVDYAVDTSSLADGAFVSASLSSAGIASSFSDVLVIGTGSSAYVVSPPPSVEIDGAFGDWYGKTTADSDAFPLANPNIDITSVGALNTSGMAYFFVSVSGEMCGGSYVPVVLTKPSGEGGGGVIIPSRKTGEDILRVYIDSDLSAASGFEVSVPSKTIGADYMFEVRGLDGKIVSKTLLRYSGSQWSVVPDATVAAANDLQRLEAAVLLPAPGSDSFDFIVETTDWRSRSDRATAAPVASRALSFEMASAAFPEGWIIESPTPSNSATAMSYQRKLFYDGVNFWSFFWDGTNTVCKYSTDGGQTWALAGSVFKTTGVNKVSVWYYAQGNIVYAVGDAGTASVNLYVQRGVVSPATHSIAWSNVDATVQVSSNPLGGKNAYVCRDAAGYVWVLSSNCTSVTPQVTYDLSAFRSAGIDAINSWIFTGNMLDTDSSQPTVKGSIVPAGSNSDMWAVYGYDGNVAARKYTGTWSPQSVIYPIGKGNPGNTERAPPSCVVDSNGVIHVVYGDGHEQPAISKPYIWYAYNAGSSWSTPYRLDSVGNTQGNLYPTISLDSATGDLYAFWVETDITGTGTTIVCKKKVGASWTSITIGGQTAGEKRYLTSVYSVPGQQYVCWQWTQNTSAPIQVLFDKIPEFPSLLLPVVGIFLLLLAQVSSRRRRR